jgi:hypothetical protein
LRSGVVFSTLSHFLSIAYTIERRGFDRPRRLRDVQLTALTTPANAPRNLAAARRSSRR